LAAAAFAALIAVVVAVSLSGGGHPHPLSNALAPKATSVTTTTVGHPAPAPAPTVVASHTGPSAATYTVSSSELDLTLLASSRCWIELRALSQTGPVIFTGTLAAGARQAFQSSTGLWIRLGYPPGVTIQVDGHALTLPATNSPFDVSLVAA
jgi:hypothetical protein